MIIAFFCVATVLLVIQDLDSIRGRFLVWKILFQGIEPSSLIFGNGIGYVESQYLDLQSKYFNLSRPMYEQLLAGQVRSSFNEFITVLIELGVIGIGLVGSLIYITYRRFHKTLKRDGAVFISITTFLLCAVFSFPFSSVSTCILIAIIYGSWMNKRMGTFGKSMRLLPKPAILGWLFASTGLLIYISISSYKDVIALRRWNTLLSKNYLVYNESQSIKESEILYPSIKNNSLIVHGHAKNLFRIGLYNESLETALHGKKLYSNLPINLLIASIYEEVGKEQLAEAYYLHCERMVPKLLVPKYLLFNLYNKSNQRAKAYKMAEKIRSFPVKVQTPEAREIKNEINHYLRTNKQQL